MGSEKPEITAMLSRSIQQHICPDNDTRIYRAREVTFDYGTSKTGRMDFIKIPSDWMYGELDKSITYNPRTEPQKERNS